jgi:hypothetical protein
MKTLWGGSVLAGALTLFLGAAAQADTVKLSRSGICHDADSPSYSRTVTFTPYGDMSSCLAIGRAYSGYDPARSQPAAATSYDRGLYGDWTDEDGDCLNTRHEVLAALSTGPVLTSPDGCRVVHGRWNDPYTGVVFTHAPSLDIDHLVPLAWAHDHGGHSWSPELRAAFANDMRNLFAVEAAVNRQKGAKGPDEWLPPNPAFRCEYILRFERIVKLYGLTYRTDEKAKVDTERQRVCM